MEEQKQKRDNGGYLFRNADKRTEKQPDFRGKMTVGGKEWLVSGWTRMKDGSEMISISLTDPATLPPRENGAAPGGSRQGASGPFSKPAAASAAPKAFQSPASKGAPPASSASDELEDLDQLFNGLN